MAVLAAIGSALIVGGATGYLLGWWRGRLSGKQNDRRDLVINTAFGGLVALIIVAVAPRIVAGMHEPVWHDGVTPIVAETELNDVVYQSSERPVLLYFYAPWCVPCRAMAPNVDKLAQSGSVVVTVNVDEAARLASLYHVRSVPTIYIFRNGQITYSGLGYHSLRTLRKLTR